METKDLLVTHKDLYQCATLLGRSQYLLDTGLFSDVTFWVNGNKKPINAHKIILAAASPVFASMFLQQPILTVIIVNDIEYDTFEHMLAYIYKDQYPGSSGSNISTNILCEKLLFAADKYSLPKLMAHCSKILASVTNNSTVCRHLLLANTYNCDDLRQKCLSLFDTNILYIFNKIEDFYSLDLNALKMIMSRDTFRQGQHREIVLFNILINWCNFKINNNEMTKCDCHRNLKQHFLDGIIYDIRFTNMFPAEFTNGPVEQDLLDDGDVVDLYKYMFTQKQSHAFRSKFNIQ